VPDPGASRRLSVVGMQRQDGQECPSYSEVHRINHDMDTLFQYLFDDSWGRLLLRHAGSEGLARTGLFVLVAARLAGLLGVGLVLGRRLLTWQVRIGLVGLLTLVVAPTLPLAQQTMDRVQIVGHEVESMAMSSLNAANTMSQVIAAPMDFVVALLCEIGLGAVLGTGVAVVLSGLKLGGEWLDRHSGLGMGSVLNPELLSEGSASAEMLLLFGVATILLMEPGGGHLLFARTILESFRALPVGMSSLSPSLFGLLGSLMRQSLVLGLRVAMPLVVAMSLIDMTFGFASRSSRWSLLPAAYAVRTAAALLILAATWPGIAEAITTTVLDSLRLTNEGLLADQPVQ
jgi:flagellar biosynthesis protein FliR